MQCAGDFSEKPQTKNHEMTPKHALERIAKWRKANHARVLEHKRRYYQRHKEQYAQWKEANPEKVSASRQRNSAKNVARAKRWTLSNKSKALESKRKSERASRDELTLPYVRKLIARHDGWEIAGLLPETFLQAKRAQIKINRLCQNLQTSKP